MKEKQEITGTLVCFELSWTQGVHKSKLQLKPVENDLICKNQKLKPKMKVDVWHILKWLVFPSLCV